MQIASSRIRVRVGSGVVALSCQHARQRVNTDAIATQEGRPPYACASQRTRLQPQELVSTMLDGAIVADITEDGADVER